MRWYLLHEEDQQISILYWLKSYFYSYVTQKSWYAIYSIYFALVQLFTIIQIWNDWIVEKNVLRICNNNIY